MPHPNIHVPLLSVDSVRVRFGGLTALNGISFDVTEGEILGLIGPNGAGKSVAINIISGFARASSGSVTFRGRSLQGLTPAQRSRLGLARTFQNLELFGSMTVWENVSCAIEAVQSHGLIPSGNRRERNDAVREILATLGLEKVTDRTVETLSYGTKKLVELARVFVRRPSFVLLDEPVAGLNRNEKAEFVELFSEMIEHYSLSGILVEHDMPTVRSLCSRLVVLDAGNQLAEGPVQETLRRPEVISAYLGPLAITSSF